MPDGLVVLDLGGARLLVTAPRASWLERVSRAFAPLVAAQDDGARPDFRLSISEEVGSPPVQGVELTWRGRLTDGNTGIIHETESSAVLIVEDGGYLVIDHAARTASAHFAPDAHGRFFGTASMMVIEAALAASGQEVVHAASLLDPRSGLAYLFGAPSGFGKTTTSLALSHGGFALMTDDASVVIADGRGPRAWGLPRSLKVHRKTAAMLPWLGELPDKWDAADEQGVTAAQLEGKVALAPGGTHPLGGVFILGPRSPHGHRVSPARKAEALIALAHENVAWRPAGMVPKAVRRFEALARTLAGVPAFALSAGPDLASLPGAVMAAIDARPASGGMAG